jgi:acylglycerol lipase
MNACPASENFFKALIAEDKQLILYPVSCDDVCLIILTETRQNAFHDLMTEPEIKDQYQEDCMSWVDARLRLEEPSADVGGKRFPWKSGEES